MKLTYWDRVVLYATGSLPKKTQAALDLIQKQELQATIDRAKAAAKVAAAKAAKAKGYTDLVKDKVVVESAPKKKATPAKKKPSK